MAQQLRTDERSIAECREVLGSNLVQRKPIARPTISEAPIELQNAKPLRRSRLSLLENITFVVLPLLPIVLTISAAILDQKPTSNFGHRVQQALLLAPTIFPIMFAAVCGRVMKSIASYRSQTGLRMRILEHLVGSQSIFSALERLLVLRNFTFAGIAITLIWGLSPLGGQAFLRLVHTEQRLLSANTGIMYLTPNILASSSFMDLDVQRYYYTRISTFYTSSLIEPLSIQSSPRDLWENVKIPVLSNATDFPAEHPGSWVDVDKISEPVHYYNLVGIPTNVSAQDEEAIFSVVSLQLDVRCTNIDIMTAADFIATGEPLMDIAADLPVNGSLQKHDLQSGDPSAFLYISNASWYDMVTDFNRDPDYLMNSTKSLRLFLGSSTYELPHNETPTYEELSILTFEATPIRLESRVRCNTEAACAVEAIRRIPTALTDLHFNILTALLTNGAFCGFGLSSSKMSSQTEQYLADPSGPDITTVVDLWNVSSDALGDRMMHALNTYWYASSIFEDIGFNGPVTGPSPTSGSLGSLNYANTTANTTKVGQDMYVTDKVWLTTSFIIAFVLEALAIAGTILHLLTKSPDILGYVSSMTMDNEWSRRQGVVTSSALHGLERSRELGDIVFAIADVGGQKDVGHIAFAPTSGHRAHEDGKEGSSGIVRSPLRLGRLYE